MVYRIYWRSANGEEGAPFGSFARRQEAEAALLDQVRAAAAALEHGPGVAGEWEPDGSLYRGDLDSEFLGRYIIEEA